MTARAFGEFATASTKNVERLQLKPQPPAAGRKPKPLTEKQSELVGLRFKTSELELIKTKA